MLRKITDAFEVKNNVAAIDVYNFIGTRINRVNLLANVSESEYCFQFRNKSDWFPSILLNVNRLICWWPAQTSIKGASIKTTSTWITVSRTLSFVWSQISFWTEMNSAIDWSWFGFSIPIDEINISSKSNNNLWQWIAGCFRGNDESRRWQVFVLEVSWICFMLDTVVTE